MEIPESNPWNPINLLLFFGGVIIVILFILYHTFPNLLGLEETEKPAPESQTTETVITESAITPLYDPDPLNLDQWEGKSPAEIKDLYNQLEQVSYNYKDLPHVDEFAIKSEIDSVMQAARDRFPHILYFK